MLFSPGLILLTGLPGPMVLGLPGALLGYGLAWLFASFWSAAQIFLFVLIGAAFDIKSALPFLGPSVMLILGALPSGQPGSC